jgi:GDP-mannose 6-dehydrogenase
MTPYDQAADRVPRAAEDIAVFGLGYVGCVTAACLASLGHRVLGVEKDRFKVSAVNDGRAPFFEPGLDDLVRAQVESGRLRATSDPVVAVTSTSIALLCVGTPSERNGNVSTEQLERVVTEIATGLRTRANDESSPYIVAVRSTVFPGTCESIVRPRLADLAAAVVSNPEFLREGTAVADFQRPSLLVVGGETSAMARVAGLYAALPVRPCLVSLRTAEMIKYACNAFHAVKIAFANEIGAVAAALDVDGAEVMRTLCQDEMLNISTAYLKPGFAFGGSCLPKDLRALVYRASRLDIHLPLLEHALPSNEAHLKRAIDQVMELPPVPLAVYGIAFKADTDDVRESPVVALLEHLIGKGREVRVYDPNIQLDAIYGSNQQFLLAHVPHIGRLMVGSLPELLAGAQALVVAQDPPARHRADLEAFAGPRIDLYAARPMRQPSAVR